MKDHNVSIPHDGNERADVFGKDPKIDRWKPVNRGKQFSGGVGTRAAWYFSRIVNTKNCVELHRDALELMT